MHSLHPYICGLRPYFQSLNRSFVSLDVVLIFLII